MNVAFIDHPLHRKTHSSNFFIDLLRQRHDVTIYYPGSEWQFVLAEVLNAGHDLAVCWQHEFFAPPLTANGLRSLIIPMYDGCGKMPLHYWQFFARLGIESINFSTSLHHQHQVAGIDSLLTRYFPDPSQFTVVNDFTTLRGFLWQRCPDEHIHWHTIIRLTCGQLDQLHIHDVPDTAPEHDIPAFENWPLLAQSVTRSEWFESRADFLATLNNANVFFAPRYCEGIGMALLEAMAQGQCVVAHNKPTHSEYIHCGRNGILVNMHYPQPTDLSHAKTLGEEARRTIEEGYPLWQRAATTIHAKINSSAKRPIPILDWPAKRKAMNFPSRYFKGMK